MQNNFIYNTVVFSTTVFLSSLLNAAFVRAGFFGGAITGSSNFPAAAFRRVTRRGISAGTILVLVTVATVAAVAELDADKMEDKLAEALILIAFVAVDMMDVVEAIIGCTDSTVTRFNCENVSANPTDDRESRSVTCKNINLSFKK